VPNQAIIDIESSNHRINLEKNSLVTVHSVGNENMKQIISSKINHIIVKRKDKNYSTTISKLAAHGGI
jgi:type IV secretory pathway VirB9-like protein